MVTSAARSVKERTENTVKYRWFTFFIPLFWTLNIAASGEPPPVPSTPVTRARVVMAEEPEATAAFRAKPDKVKTMVNRGITFLTGTTNVAAAWKSLVSTQDVIGLKVFSAPGGSSGTRPSVVAAVVEGLLAAGIAPAKIIVWDKQLGDLRAAGYGDIARRYKIRLAGSADEGYDETAVYENPVLGNLVYGDRDFEKKSDVTGRKSYVSKLVTRQITKIINITPLLNHNEAGVTGNLYSLAMGSVDNTLRFEPSERLAGAVPEIYALPSLSDHVVLNIVDALICQYQGEQRSLLHYSTALNQIWLSKDPVALDVLALEELNRQRRSAGIEAPKANLELYQNAALLELGVNEIKNIRIEMAR